VDEGRILPTEHPRSVTPHLRWRNLAGHLAVDRIELFDQAKRIRATD
jgi:Ribonuclease G/E